MLFKKIGGFILVCLACWGILFAFTTNSFGLKNEIDIEGEGNTLDITDIKSADLQDELKDQIDFEYDLQSSTLDILDTPEQFTNLNEKELILDIEKENSL